MFLVLGCFLDVSVLLLVFVPMLLPAAKLLGVDLVHFGVLVVLNMMIGLIHPPFGMLLFVTKALTGIPIGEMMKEGWPFLVMLLLLLVAMIFGVNAKPTGPAGNIRTAHGKGPGTPMPMPEAAQKRLHKPPQKIQRGL
jgi:TRAP-type C4-dicarboxylate transport system permease large subunit